ncbi:hypothetical protein [Streptomyces yanii]|uniref:Uncharacterized protein n=1 Tax=Streptomyces yanii TaxID=78510 RepID=A0ABV5RBJ2_9ACTN
MVDKYLYWVPFAAPFDSRIFMAAAPRFSCGAVAMSGSTKKAADVGLPVVDVSPGVDYAKLQYEFVQRNPEMALEPRGNQDDDSDADDFRFGNIARLFAEVGAPTVDRAIELARRRRPDVVLPQWLTARGRGRGGPSRAARRSVGSPLTASMQQAGAGRVYEPFTEDGGQKNGIRWTRGIRAIAR